MLQIIVVGLHQQGIAHPRNQFRAVDGLAQKLGSAQFQCLDFRFLVVRGRDHDHRQIGPLPFGANPFQQFQPADLGHNDVKQHDVGLVLRDSFQRRPWIDHAGYVLITGNTQILLHHFDVDRFVVDDHHLAVGGPHRRQVVGPQRKRHREGFLHRRRGSAARRRRRDFPQRRLLIGLRHSSDPMKNDDLPTPYEK